MSWEYLLPKTTMNNLINQLYQYQMNQSGLFSCGFYWENLFFLSNQSKLENSTIPDIEIQTSDNGEPIYLIDVIHQYPQFINQVTLSDIDPLNPLSPPKISSWNWTSRDIEVLVDAIVTMREIIQFEPLNSTLGRELLPGSTPLGQDTREFLRQYVRTTGIPPSHYVGTTRMGSDNDPMAVTDSQLRIKGIQKLRTCDAGSIPLVTNGNIHATVLMLAQRCVDFILSGS